MYYPAVSNSSFIFPVQFFCIISILCLLLIVFCSLIDQEPQTELVAQLAQEFYNHDIFLPLVTHLSKLDFEVWCFILFIVVIVLLSCNHNYHQSFK